MSRCVDDASDMASSSVSDETLPERTEGCVGKQNVGSVGMETGREGLDERLRRCGKVGEMGDDCGVLRRRNVEMGVLATKSGSRDSFSGRRLVVRPRADERRATLRIGDMDRGEVDRALDSNQDMRERRSIVNCSPERFHAASPPLSQHRAD